MYVCVDQCYQRILNLVLYTARAHRRVAEVLGEARHVEQLVAAGRVRSIGLSNFNEAQIRALLRTPLGRLVP